MMQIRSIKGDNYKAYNKGLQDLAETLEEGLGEFLLNLGIDHLHSTIETIVSKTNRNPSY